jgi:RHS repeat-associated protein
LNQTWTNTFDVQGRLLTSSDPQAITLTRTYDSVGKLLSQTDRLGRTTTFAYDLEGRPLARVDAFGLRSEWAYDGEGQLIEMRRPSGRITTQTFDLDGRLVMKQSSGQNPTTFAYNDWGQPIQVQDAHGRLTHFGYTSFGELLSRETADLREEFHYDPRGQRLQRTLLWGQNERIEEHFAYDAAGRNTAVTDGQGQVTRSEYDALGRKTAEIDALGNRYAFAYELRDQMIAFTDSNGNPTHFEYDRLGRQTARIDALGQREDSQYDALSRITQIIDGKNQKQVRRYHSLGHLMGQDFYDQAQDPTPAKTVTYEQDALGRSTGWSDGRFAETIAYDDAAREKTHTLDYGPFAKSITYSYDLEGRKAGLRDAEGTLESYTYDADGRQEGQTIAGVGTLEFAHDADGRLRAILFPGPTGSAPGVSQTFSFDPLGRMVSNRAVAPDGAILLEESYSRNRLGDITRRDTERGTFLYGYDALRQLSSADYPYPELPDDAFTYDPMGNRLSDAAGTSYAYNALNQLTGMTPAGGTSVSFTFDAAGNMTQDGSATPQPTLSWDESNRLSSYDRPAGVSSPAIHAEYAYAPDARRLLKTVDGVTTYFLYSEEGLRAEYDAEGHPIRTYAYRPNTLWMTQPLLLHARPLGAPPTEPLITHLYLVDHLHASEKLATLSGILAWQAQESAFGAATPAPSATVENPLRLSSQYYDAETTLHYNTERYYGPIFGSYLLQDPLDIDASFNLYMFAFLNPSTYIDPKGAAVYLCSRLLGNADQPPTDRNNPARHDFLWITTFRDGAVGLQRGSNFFWSSGNTQDGQEYFNTKCTMICSDDRFDAFVQAEVGWDIYQGVTYAVGAFEGTWMYACGARNCQSWVRDILRRAKKEYLEKIDCPKCFK